MLKKTNYKLTLILLISAMLSVLLLSALISACASTSAKDTLDWAGRYTGTIPAADCPGINVDIILNTDYTYTLIYDYIDRDDSFKKNGAFKFDKTGSIIILSDNSSLGYYKPGKDHLLQLDTEGKKITGNFADMYVLKKN